MNSTIEKISPKWLWGLVLLGALLVHASYFDNGFAWLDHGDIEQRRAVLPITEIGTAFSQPFGETGFYRPLVTIVHSLDAALYGNRAPGFHATNVALFLLAVAAVALFVPAFFGVSKNAGLLAALVFAVHPLSWLPVGAISYRPELLAAGLTCLSVFFYIRMRRTSRMSFAAGFVTCFALALFSKETPLFWLPMLVGAFEFFEFRAKKSAQASAKAAAKRTIGVAIAGAIFVLAGYVVLRMAALPEIWHTSAPELSVPQAIFTRLHVLGVRISELISPLLPALSDATAIHSSISVPGIFALVVVLAGCVLAVRSGRESLLAKIFVFVAITLAPALNLVALPRFSSPHYGFFAAIACGVVFARIFQSSAKWRALPQKSARSALVVWLGIAAFFTFTHGARFANDRTLFAPEVERDPRFLEGHFYLGEFFMKTGDAGRAAAAYRHALKIDPQVIAYVDYSSAMINLAGAELQLGNAQEAERLLTEVSGTLSANEQRLVDYNLALLANRRGDHQRVVDLLAPHQNHWQRPEPLMMLARALRYLERTAEAIAVLQRALPYLDADQQVRVRALIEASK